MKKDRYVIVDTNTDTYYLCWSEGNSIFLTEDILEAENTGTIEDAKRLLSMINSSTRFLSDETDKELNKLPTLKIALMKVSYELV